MGSEGIAPLIPSLSTIWKLITSTHWALCPRERAHSTRHIGSSVGATACWMLPLLRTGRQFRNIIWKCAIGISFVINTNLCYLYLRLSICKFKQVNLEVEQTPLTSVQQCWSNESCYVRQRFTIFAQPPQRTVRILWIKTQTVLRQTHHTK
jgi:Na+/melibiose symporter-like transporter